MRRDGSEGESVWKVDCGEVCKGMVEVGSEGIADGVVALGLYGDSGVVSSPSRRG